MMTEAEANAILNELVNTSITDPKYLELAEKYPMPPEFALVVKDVYGADFMRNSGFNFEKVEAQYGKNWLSD